MPAAGRGLGAAGALVGCRPVAGRGLAGSVGTGPASEPVPGALGALGVLTGVGGAPSAEGSTLTPGGGLVADAVLRGPGGPIWPSTKGVDALVGTSVWKAVGLDRGLEGGSSGLDTAAAAAVDRTGAGLKGGSSRQQGR